MLALYAAFALIGAGLLTASVVTRATRVARAHGRRRDEPGRAPRPDVVPVVTVASRDGHLVRTARRAALVDPTGRSPHPARRRPAGPPAPGPAFAPHQVGQAGQAGQVGQVGGDGLSA